MNLFGYDISKTPRAPDEAPPGNFFSEQALADSPLYEPYQLRPYNPDDLYQRNGNYDIVDEMVQDEQISAILTLKKFLILGSKWEIQSDDEKVKEFLEIALYDHLDGMLEKKLFEILSSIEYGFSLTEKIFSYEEVEGFGKKIVLSKLKTVPPHGIYIYQDKFGNIEKIEQDASGASIFLNINKYIHYKYQEKFQNPFGTSELNLGVYRAWWSKNAIIKFWNIFLERFGMPTVVGTYPKNLKGEKDRLKKVLKNIQAKTGIVVPEGVVLDLLEKSSGSSGQSEYESALDKYNTLIARKMLVPDLMGFSGSETGGGSYSLGKEQFNMFYNNIKHEERNLLRIINRDIVNPLVLWNFGSGYKAEFIPSQVDDAKRSEDIKNWLEGVKTNKVPVNFESINWFLKSVNAPEIDEAEFEAIEEEKKEMAEAISGDPEDDKPDDKKDDKTVDKKEESKPVDKAKETKPPEAKEEKKFVKSEYYREFTEYEKKVNFAKIDDDQQKLTEKYVAELSEAYKLSINALINDIKTKKIIEKKRLDQINKLQLKYQPRLKKIYLDMNKESYMKGTESIEKKEFAIFGPEALDDEDIAQWLSENAIYTETVEAQEILKKVKGTIMDGIREGAGSREMMTMVEDTLKGYDIVLKSPRIETIVRTNVSKAYNESRKDQYVKLNDEIKAYQFSAIMDGRTSPVCTKLDQKIFKPSELSYYNPPIHYNCRSLIVPIFNDEELEGFSKMPDTVQEDGGFLQTKEQADKKIERENKRI